MKTPPVETLPRDDDGPVFKEPWEAKAFALVLALHERGLFTWPEWAAALAQEIADPGDMPETSYYHLWLAALEKLVAEKNIADRETQFRYQQAWDRAADRTPHGQPIELSTSDFAQSN
jgi:nitrile hydratase accessory protein